MKDKRILITGGAGFIGSHLVKLFVKKYPNYRIINLDALTYAGNLENLSEIASMENYSFIKGSITDSKLLEEVFNQYQITDVIHTAAESHVDRSINDPLAFINTNLVGTAQLLITAKNNWSSDKQKHTFYHMSTDEVYGSLAMDDSMFEETTAYDPRSPYSASKAGSDHLVRAFYHTYGLQTKISNCSNNYGPNQFPEKLIPLFINNIKKHKSLPVYGQGLNVRDWLHVEDHASAVDEIFHRGKVGETYNIGGLNEWKNIDLIHLLINIVDEELGRPSGQSEGLITFVKDRAGHDLRYAIDCSKLQRELGWNPRYTFEEGLRNTVRWYLKNETWLDRVTSGEYLKYYEQQYGTHK